MIEIEANRFLNRPEQLGDLRRRLATCSPSEEFRLAIGQICEPQAIVIGRDVSEPGTIIVSNASKSIGLVT
jgi:hypothetical protein